MSRSAGGAFARDYSLEATRPDSAELAAVAAIAGPGRALYLSSVAKQSLQELAGLVARVRQAGLEPVPHLAARRIATAADLADFLARARNEADLRRVLVIAGDIETAGAFPDAFSLIRSGLLQKAGIEEIGIAGYPESHPRIPAADLMRAMQD